MSFSTKILSCPLCHTALSLETKTLRCAEGHSYDMAKEGYVNLLLANQKKSKLPGDSTEMIQARRAFLEQGHYDPLINKINKLLTEHLPTEQNIFLDAGCGEGYYTQKIHSAEQLSIEMSYGCDVSKAAIKAASKKHKHINFFVGNVMQLPIIDQSVDIAMTIFAPINKTALKKILKDSGILLIVSAGPTHLKELAALIYDEVQAHSYDPLDQLTPDFFRVAKASLSFELNLSDTTEITNLLKMTPYYWRTTPEKIEHITSQTDLTVSCDFELSIFKIQA